MTPPQSAIVFSIDRLGASWLGPYGNTWLDTPNFNRLAAQSLLFETAIADSPDISQACRAWWMGRHVLETDSGFDVSLAALATAVGARSILVTDDSAVAEHPLAASFGELQIVKPVAVAQGANDVEETGLFQLLSAAIATLDECQTPALVWIHARGPAGPWDAPPDFRNRFADEDDPPPPTLTEPPNVRLPPGGDPDVALGYVQAYAGQVALADLCLGMLMDAVDEHPLAASTLFAVTSPRGYPLGEHGRVGACDDALYGELLHVPLLVRFPDRAHNLTRTQRIVQPHELSALLAESCGWLPSAPLPGSSLLAELNGEVQPTPRLACSHAPGQRAIRTPAWFLREAQNDGAISRELFAKPDDRFEANEVASRCHDEVELLAAELDRFDSAARAGELPQLAPLAEQLCELWR